MRKAIGRFCALVMCLTAGGALAEVASPGVVAASAAIRAIGFGLTTIEALRPSLGPPLFETDTNAGFAAGGYRIFVTYHSRTANTWPYPRGSIYKLTLTPDPADMGSDRLSIDGDWNARPCPDDDDSTGCGRILDPAGPAGKTLAELLRAPDLCEPKLIASNASPRPQPAVLCDSRSGDGAIMLSLRIDAAGAGVAGLGASEFDGLFAEAPDEDQRKRALERLGAFGVSRLEIWNFGPYAPDPALPGEIRAP